MRVRSSKRPRPGQRFEPVQERFLRTDALDAIGALPHAHRGLSIWREVAGPYGIPDFLAVVGDPQKLADRSSLPVPPLLNEIDAGIVANAPLRSGLDAQGFAERLEWSPASIERRLPRLARIGALAERGDRFVRPKGLNPIGRVYAIETKVKDWRRALKQARTYGLWCDNYVVVMSAISEGSLSEASANVAQDGGGLYVAGRWVLRPRAQNLNAARRLWGSEHVLAAIGRASSPALRGSKASKSSE
jgi:hypothetical protein